MARFSAAILLFISCVPLFGQGPATAGTSTPGIEPTTPRGVKVVQNGSYPELRVDGEPYFVHGATFEYYRIPRDLWESSLDRYAELGINTIVLSIPWNWHEPREAEFDFDGHTNPRRDLRTLLRQVAEKGFKLVARPGPIVGRTDGAAWRLGGYPEWLLARPEYKMDTAERQSGAYPPLAELNETDAEAAARGWLENATHMAEVQKWLAAVARELAPYMASRTLRVPSPGGKKGHPEEKEISGPLLWVQLDSSPVFAAGPQSTSSFWRYMNELRDVLRASGLETIVTINPTHLEKSPPGAPPLDLLIALTGQWLLPPRLADKVSELPAPWKLTSRNEAELDLLARALATQPQFPPVVADFQAGWRAPEDDWRPPEVFLGDTLLASRLLMARGVSGIVYSPLQDGLTPAGWDVPGANRVSRWDAALDLAGNHQPRAQGVQRNARLLEQSGALLAASHTRADFGMVDLRASPPAGATNEDVATIERTLEQVQRVGALAGLEGEWLDPAQQPVEQLLRHAVLFLPAPPRELDVSEKAQRALADYVERGGTLVFFPSRPAGKIFAALWGAAAAPAKSADAPTERVGGQGRIIEWSKDFYSWVKLDQDAAENRAQFEAAWATQSFRTILERAGVRPAVRRSAFALRVTQRVANEGTEALGARSAACSRESLCGQGLLSVSNPGDDTVEETLEVLSPRAGARGSGDPYIPLTVVVPPRESLLLPLHAPLCSAAPPTRTCRDEVTSAGAELLHVERDDKTLELTFYTPARATIRLRLEQTPARIRMDEISVEGHWTPAEQTLEVTLPRGASPNFVRVLKLRLPYTPHVPQKADPSKNRRRDFTFAVADAVRLPLGPDASLPTEPPLIILDANRTGHLLARADNYDEMGREIHVRLEGPVRGSERMILDGNETLHEKMKLGPGSQEDAGRNGTAESTNGLLRGELEARSSGERLMLPIVFASVAEGKTARYQLDFDRDGAPEWVLENERLRLILQPEAGGSAVALVDKTIGTSLITTVGGVRDSIVFATGRVAPIRAYRGEWVEGPNGPGVRMRSIAAEGEGATTVEKAIQIVAPETVEVGYRYRSAPPTEATGIQLETLTSVPAQVHQERSTRFCWSEGGEAEPRCADFQRGGPMVEVPARAHRLEVRTAGSPGFAVEWKGGRMKIEMKEFSALLRLALPATPEPQQVRYTILPPE